MGMVQMLIQTTRVLQTRERPPTTASMHILAGSTASGGAGVVHTLVRKVAITAVVPLRRLLLLLLLLLPSDVDCEYPVSGRFKVG